MADNDAATSTAVVGERERRGFFGRILLFVRQVIDEMRKVVYPTRDELTSFTIAVLVFLAVIMAYVNGLDWMFTRAVSWVFGSG